MTITDDTQPLPRWLLPVLALLALAAIAVPLILVLNAPRIPPTVAGKVVRPQRVVPKAELPPVEPIKFQAVAPQDARAFNATIPFSTAPNPAARPFRIFGSPVDQARAVDCLAAALIYEAGDDPVGQRAVGQVVLNRVRHPAYPNSVCGVVFQGSERRTGCQFTFTCDGAIMRAVNAGAWNRARSLAMAALNGSVDARVGLATHYHTDWVVPYWSASLDKITEVNTHLFFRWTGWWGTPPAFRDRYTGAEPNIPKLSRISAMHNGPTPAELAAMAAAGVTDPALVDPALNTVIPKGLEQDANTFLVTLDGKLGAESFPAFAARTCGDRPYCKFMAWTNKGATPAALPVTPVQQRAMSFSYLRDRAFGFEKALWNCGEFKRDLTTQCMKSQLSITMAAPPPTNFTYDATPGSALKGIANAAGAGAAKPTGPDPLTGVRRRVPGGPVPMDPGGMPAPKATPTPVVTPTPKGGDE
jgi:spore germination cell wall hydrolase CwlJ-like protein